MRSNINSERFFKMKNVENVENEENEMGRETRSLASKKETYPRHTVYPRYPVQIIGNRVPIRSPIIPKIGVKPNIHKSASSPSLFPPLDLLPACTKFLRKGK
jgi:hypothetical protein